MPVPGPLIVASVICAPLANSGDPWSSPLVSGSGWLLTLAGTGVAVFTLYQVRSKNSAFRRALIVTTKHRTHRDLQSVAANLTDLNSRLVRVRSDGSTAKSIAQDWMRIAPRSEALHEISVADDPLLPDGPAGPWKTRQGKRFGAAAQQLRAAVTDTATRTPADGLREAIERSCALAAEYLLAPSDESRSAFSHAASVAISRLAYVCERLAYAEIGDIHDDR